MKTAHSARSKRIRVVIADDHPIVREGLRAVLKTQRDIEVVAEAANGPQAIEQFLLHRPDVLLLDLRMPEMDGIGVLRAVLEKKPDAKIVVVTHYGGDQDIYRTLHAGAKAYLLKDSPRQELLECIRAVHAGRRWISPPVGAQLAAGMEMPQLTRREVEIIRLMANGKSNKEIGDSLGISDNTVKVHVRNMFRKLGATSRTEALRIALLRGIAHLDDHMAI
ncbi:MAG TPA: response regulator transcription factor [Candidatus Dormibacteraeota bacterium]|nr:response regulator transcription factor [Candidatus Dormibacteraeota bacterium]